MNTAFTGEARVVRTSADLTDLLAGIGRGCAVADLTLGSWAPQSLATQLLSQLTGRELGPHREASSAGRSLGEAMSAGIDLEGKGNGALLTAAATAKQIARAVERYPSALAILLPAFGAEWRMADRLLLEYLQALYPQVEVRFGVLEGNATGDVPLVAKLPTAIAPSVLQTLADAEQAALLPLPNGWAVVRPEFRGAVARFSAREVQTVQRGALRPLAVYAAFHAESSVASDPWQFCVEAWSQFGSGYRELAVLYMSEALTRAHSTTDRQTFQCHRQAMRVAMADYPDAGAEEIGVDPEMPAAVRGFLLETKGWGLVMSGNPKPALPLLRDALALLKPTVPDAAYLFLMNITALAEVRSGNFDAALRLEREIEDTIAGGTVDDARLVFVNSLNLARLYRYAEDLPASERYYQRAFATVEGGRTPTDAVNANLCLARVYEGRGEHGRVFTCWLRAAMHWIASDLPESLNWRVQSLVLGKGGTAAITSRAAAVELVERLAASFVDSLRRYGALAGVAVECGPQTKITPFAIADPGVARWRILRAVGSDGWSVLRGSGVAIAKQYGPRYEELNRWLSAFVEAHADESAGESCNLLYTRDGGEIPQTREELLESAAEFGVSRIRFQGTDEEVSAQERPRRAERNPLVSAATEDAAGVLTVQFRRYLPPVRLAGADLRLFRAVEDHPYLKDATAVLQAEGWLPGQVEQAVASLRKHRLIRVRRDEATVRSNRAVPTMAAAAVSA